MSIPHGLEHIFENNGRFCRQEKYMNVSKIMGGFRFISVNVVSQLHMYLELGCA